MAVLLINGAAVVATATNRATRSSDGSGGGSHCRCRPTNRLGVADDEEDQDLVVLAVVVVQMVVVVVVGTMTHE